jgi:arylformamidase
LLTVKKKTWIDISPELSPKSAVFPGDTALSLVPLMQFAKGDPLYLSALTMTPHLGAHADSPSHYHPEGCDIATRDLDFFLGRCQVIHVDLAPGERILPEHLQGKKIEAERVLFRTLSFPDPNHWRDDFNSLSPELIAWLAKHSVKLVGLDTPSVDPANDKELKSHNAIYKNDMAVLEGLVLDHVHEGFYFLIALPLKIKNADASPVRAILLEDSPWKKS